MKNPGFRSGKMSAVLDSGTHTFEIARYSDKRGLGVGWFDQSATFTVGGFDWAVRFYPNGVNSSSRNHVVASLGLVGTSGQACARYVLRFIHRAPQMQMIMTPLQMFSAGSAEVIGFFRSSTGGFSMQNIVGAQRSPLERLGNLLGYYIVGDRLTIQCDITVLRGESQLVGNRYNIEVPPCDMMQHFGNLFKEKKGVDVTFLVGEETIEAHKVVLAARSPVFKAQFFGPMVESGTCFVTVQDMLPEAFRALLHFIYNDSLPDMGDLEGNDYGEMMWHLLAAADRYAMDRMKLVCQHTICKNLDVETVATTLVFADRHNCDKLKAACIEFIASPKNADAVAATQGYGDLKRECPSVFIDLFERQGKLAKHR
jgi:speckle-type POZ protein